MSDLLAILFVYIIPMVCIGLIALIPSEAIEAIKKIKNDEDVFKETVVLTLGFVALGVMLYLT